MSSFHPATPLRDRTLGRLDPRVEVPRYNRDLESVGIAHFGVGGFHRSHEAMYVDRLLSAGEHGWGICGIGLLPNDRSMRDALDGQDGLYTLILRASDGTESVRIIGSILDYAYAPDTTADIAALLAQPNIRIVSLTITEGGYNFDQSTGRFRTESPAVQRDLLGKEPTVFGYIVRALQERKRRGLQPFTVLSCDNIPGNGDIARAAVLGFASALDKDLAGWIEENVSFPNSMVDRITPVTTDEDRQHLVSEYGVGDAWPVVAETFEQWVIEDQFPAGRPPFEAVGAQLVDDVVPYELMKLRMLNGSHVGLGYLGALAGYRYANEAVQDPAIRRFIRSYMRHEAAPTLPPVPGIDLDEYGEVLVARFGNPSIRDTIERLIADASDRVPKFVVPVIAERLQRNEDSTLAALTIAAWIRLVQVRATEAPALPDPLQAELAALASSDNPARSFLQQPQLFGSLSEHVSFVTQVETHLRNLTRDGVQRTIDQILGVSRDK